MWTGGGRQREGGKRRRGRSGVGGRVWVTRRPCHVRFQPQPTSSTGPPRVSTSLRDVGVSSEVQVHLVLPRDPKETQPYILSATQELIYLFLRRVNMRACCSLLTDLFAAPSARGAKYGLLEETKHVSHEFEIHPRLDKRSQKMKEKAGKR